MSGEPICHEDAERAVLGAALLSVTALDECIALQLAPEDFWVPAHGCIWAALLAVGDAGRQPDVPDVIAVGEEMARRGDLLRCGGLPFLHDLISADRLPTTVNAGYHATLVLRAALRRRMVRAGVQITQLAESGAAGGEDLHSVLDFVRREVEDATSDQRTANGTATSAADAVWSFVEALDGPAPGVVPTPWPELDEILLGGLRAGELILLAARTSVGKSLAALEIAAGAARSGCPSTVITCEMDRNELMARLVASTGTVPLSMLVEHRVPPEEMDRVKRAAGRIAELPLVIEEMVHPSVAEIRSHVRTAHRTRGLGLAVVDQLSFLKPSDPRAQTRDQLSQIGIDLKSLARELAIPVLLVHQLNRGPTSRADKRPDWNSDIRDTDALAHHSDKVMLLWRPEDKPGRITVIVGKHRNGPVGEVELGFEGRYARIVSAHSSRW